MHWEPESLPSTLPKKKLKTHPSLVGCGWRKPFFPARGYFPGEHLLLLPAVSAGSLAEASARRPLSDSEREREIRFAPGFIPRQPR